MNIMLPVTYNKLKIQKVDRRMSGHQNFKYRLELPYCAFQGIGHNPSTAYSDRAKTFLTMCRHFTELYGYGPSVDDAYVYANYFGLPPRWGFRLLSHSHTYAIYLSDEESKSELEKILVFGLLQQA